jgi:hypothetical protein
MSVHTCRNLAWCALIKQCPLGHYVSCSCTVSTTQNSLMNEMLYDVQIMEFLHIMRHYVV